MAAVLGLPDAGAYTSAKTARRPTTPKNNPAYAAAESCGEMLAALVITRRSGMKAITPIMPTAIAMCTVAGLVITTPCTVSGEACTRVPSGDSGPATPETLRFAELTMTTPIMRRARAQRATTWPGRIMRASLSRAPFEGWVAGGRISVPPGRAIAHESAFVRGGYRPFGRFRLYIPASGRDSDTPA